MKKVYLPVALLAVFGTMTVSCQKESDTDTSFIEKEAGTVCTIRYSVDDLFHSVSLHSDSEYEMTLSGLLALARNGKEVEIYANSVVGKTKSTEKVEIYRTESEREASEWCRRKIEEGCDVRISFDEKEKIFICVAVYKN